MTPRMEDDAFFMADGARLPLRRWEPDQEARAIVLGLHGMNDYSLSYEGAGVFLSRRGVALYAYDQRGFGESPHRGFWAGRETLTHDAAQALRLLTARHPQKPVFLMGESMGGAIAMLTALRPDFPETAGLILSAPAVWSKKDMPFLHRAALWFGYRLAPGARLSGKGLDIMPSDNIDMLRALSQDPLIIRETRIDVIKGVSDLMDDAQAATTRLSPPLLILYGEKDQIIPAAPILRMVRNLPGTGGPRTAALYQNGWHMLFRDLDAALVLGDIAAFVEKPGSPPPSGADKNAIERLERLANE